MTENSRDQVFISYSHKDGKWLDLLLTHLRPHARQGSLDIWSDRKLIGGDEWREEIKRALARAKVAVLLVSPDFLASDFIAEKELPPLLEAHKKEGLIIHWVAVRASAYDITEIAKYQALNTPSQPLNKLSVPAREEQLVQICKRIVEAARTNNSSNTNAPQQEVTLESTTDSKHDPIRRRDVAVRSGPSFSDVPPTHEFYKAIEDASARNVIPGYDDGTFRPENNMTRGQFIKAVTVHRGLEINDMGGPHFTNVPSYSPFYYFIETAFNNGLISGNPDGTMQPYQDVTIAEVCKVVVLAQRWSVQGTVVGHFTDVPVGNPYYPFIETAYHHRLISGNPDGTLHPDAPASRGFICQVLYNL